MIEETIWRRTPSRPGHYRLPCPVCASQRRNRRDHSLSVERHDDHVLYRCWHCEMSGRVNDPDKRTPVRHDYLGEYVTTESVEEIQEAAPSPFSTAQEFLKSRGISESTSDAFAVAQSEAFFQQVRGRTPAVAFPYYSKKGRFTGHKLRSLNGKFIVCSRRLDTFFGTEVVDPSNKTLVIVEGEIDALSMYEAGIENALSVPNGASFSTSEDAFSYLRNAESLFEQAERVIIATDDDDPGTKLGEELARRIGRFKCWKVSWPDDCKDANDVLLKIGPGALKSIVELAEPWPVSGLYEAEAYLDDFWKLYEGAEHLRVGTGFPAVDRLYSVTPGKLSIWTGLPSSGKSTMVDHIMVHLTEERGWTHAICSFENPPDEHMAKLIQARTGKHFFDKTAMYGGNRLTKEEISAQLPWVARHFKFISERSGEMLSIDAILENAKAAVFRWGVKTLVIDPYNYIQRPSKMESETQWISEILSRVRLFAAAYDVHVFFVAHPTKQMRDAEGCYRAPDGNSISGGAAWWAKADFGVTIHRPDGDNRVEFIVWKRRSDWLGQEGKTELLYDLRRNQYIEGIVEQVTRRYEPPPQPPPYTEDPWA